MKKANPGKSGDPRAVCGAGQWARVWSAGKAEGLHGIAERHMVAWSPLLASFILFHSLYIKNEILIFPRINSSSWFLTVRSARLSGARAILLTLLFCVVFCHWSLLQAQELMSSQRQEAQGVASWYSESDAGILATTANMEPFDDEQLTCAIWDVPFNTLIRVTNLDNGKSIIVRVNDRGRTTARGARPDYRPHERGFFPYRRLGQGPYQSQDYHS